MCLNIKLSKMLCSKDHKTFVNTCQNIKVVGEF